MRYKDKIVKEVFSVPSTFFDFVAAVNGQNTAGNYRAHVQRVRMVLETRLVTDNDDKVAMEYDAIPQLSAQLGRLCIRTLEGAHTANGKITGPGDGMDTPIIFTLTKPLGMRSSLHGEISVTELEFQVPNFGALEPILAAANAMLQTKELITRCTGTPQAAGLAHGGLPLALLSQISMGDGLSIMATVLPIIMKGE